MNETLSAVLALCRARLAEAGLADAATDARVLVAGLLDLSPTELLLRSDRIVDAADRARIEAALARRIAREPVHRILGARDFYGVRLTLSPETLEPRPDTEILVEAMLLPARQLIARKGSARLLDLGTGTGAIALALLKEIPELQAVGVDLSSGALETARRNADLNDVAERFSTVESRWFDRLVGRFDIIVSNPPYITRDVIAELDPDVRRYDPILALDGGPDGLDAYRAIAGGIDNFLEEDGWIGLEIGFDQKQTVTALFSDAGYTLTDAFRDYGGQDRVLVFTRKNP
ncbi:peptide chain release factor N(5)-glutamine methyltransferase [Rhizobium straminoryzae]|uniref:Release factor glutamine methyltransferase n=1 Tax=Rhizobium straminoryzae TaxID=1387186 RepID=A0A549T1V1_9HYPH|nr:peptide chain release factor N(5)-glutamine methyltransferase [Rhizobium straminoryzae]TRL35846.1 peptide chain release factor N(5)-glutamine methyltransferase [Rhizobium straminoryzae]